MLASCVFRVWPCSSNCRMRAEEGTYELSGCAVAFWTPYIRGNSASMGEQVSDSRQRNHCHVSTLTRICGGSR